MAKKIDIHRVTNANIYIDETNLLGRAIEIKLPDIAPIMTEHKMLGMIGTLDLPTGGYGKLEGTIKWNSFYEDAWLPTLDPTKVVALQCRSSVDTYDSTGRSNQQALVTHLSVIFKKDPLGTYKQNENAEFESEFEAIALHQTFDGKDVVKIDYLANIVEIGGEDIMARYRDIIGA